MHAVFLPGGRKVDIREISVPNPGPGEVLIAVQAAGLCGSDLHMHYRPAPEHRYGPIFGLKTDPNVVPGHEPAGTVIGVGTQVKALHLGDRVAVHHVAGCGQCTECRRGWDINCGQKFGIYGLDLPGAMQDRMVVRSRDCVLVPSNITFAEAAYYTCGAGAGYLALRRAGLGVGDTVAVVGLGPVGLAAAYFARQSGAVVVGLDPVESRRAFATNAGVAIAFDPTEETVNERLREALGNSGADVVIESSGSARGRLLALDVAGLRGRVVCVGFGDSDNVIDVQRTVIQKQLEVRGSWMFPLPDLQKMLEDISVRGLSVTHLISGAFAIEDAARAWAVFDQGGPGKAVLEWVQP
jgi:threonine dehydrogenase-like Zn-dependent dehydrogenase